MFRPGGLTWAEENAFAEALTEGRRRLRFRAQLFTHYGRGLSTPLDLLDGEVQVDCTRPKEQPSRTAHVTFADPKRTLAINLRHTGSGEVWFSNMIGLTWGIWVRAISQWVDVPVFLGPIFEVARRGAVVDVDLQGKEAGHLDPALFFRSYLARRHSRVHAAIRDLFERRGETEFALDETHRRLARDKAWGPEGVPWRAGQVLADVVDKQLFYRGNGDLRLRDVPDNPVWRFVEGRSSTVIDYPEERFSINEVENAVLIRGERTVKVQIHSETRLREKAAVGATSIKVESAKNFQAGRRIEIGRGDNVETRKIDSGYSSGTTIPLAKALDAKHPEGAPVTVSGTEERARPVIGRAELTQNHPLSAAALSGGKRPRVHVEDRPGIHRRETAQARAEKRIGQMKVGVEQQVSASTATIPNLEELDPVAFLVGDVELRSRLKRFTIPLNDRDLQELNWVRERSPRRGRRRYGRGR